jgi:hypothetical protein
MHAEHADSRELNELSGRVIGCAFTVLNTLGAGFPEHWATRIECNAPIIRKRLVCGLPAAELRHFAPGDQTESSVCFAWIAFLHPR